MFSWAIGRFSSGLERVRIRHDKRAIGVRAIEVRLYAFISFGITKPIIVSFKIKYSLAHHENTPI